MTIRPIGIRPGAIRSYTAGVRRLLSWCKETASTQCSTNSTVTAFVADSPDHCEATTAGDRLLAVERFFAWAAEEGEQPEDRYPSAVQKVLVRDQFARASGGWY